MNMTEFNNNEALLAKTWSPSQKPKYLGFVISL